MMSLEEELSAGFEAHRRSIKLLSYSVCSERNATLIYVLKMPLSIKIARKRVKSIV